VQVLVKVLPDDGISVHTNTNLFQEGVDVGVKFAFTSLLHDYHGTASALNVVLDVLKLVASEG